MLKRLVFTSLLTALIIPGIYCQQSDYIVGKIADSKTAEPVPFAAVHLKDSQFGVYSNADGDFRIMKNPEFISDSIVVTCIGYYRLTIAYSSLQNVKMNNIKLVRNIYGLKEVKVIAKKKHMNSEAIVARAIRNIKKNCPEFPYSYVSYYRDYQKDSSKYLNLNEAIVQTLDKGFNFPSDSNSYRLLNFKKNLDFENRNVTPFYDLPGTEHSDVWYKKIPYAFVGDQYGNELFILLVHDAFRNYKKRSFSFVYTLSEDFIMNHWFAEPSGVYNGNTLLYKIDFTAKRKVTEDNYSGSIYIHPEDYSIYKLEYNGSYTDKENRIKPIFNIEIEYGRQSSVDSRMCLKYISFNNNFIVQDSTDTDYFKFLSIEWQQDGGPYAFLDYPPNMNIMVHFNRDVDPVSGGKTENYDLLIGKRKAKVTNVKVAKDYVYVRVRDDKFRPTELDSCHIMMNNILDINGNLLDRRRDLEFRQFRELFVQEYNKPLIFQNDCFIKYLPLDKNCISHSAESGRFWMNTPLRAEELN